MSNMDNDDANDDGDYDEDDADVDSQEDGKAWQGKNHTNDF